MVPRQARPDLCSPAAASAAIPSLSVTTAPISPDHKLHHPRRFPRPPELWVKRCSGSLTCQHVTPVMHPTQVAAPLGVSFLF